MKKLKIFGVCLVFLLLISTVSADKTVKTIEIPFGYVAQTVANQWYEKDIPLQSPDGIEKILTAELILKGDFQADTKIYMQIEGENCNEEFWTIPNQDVPNYLVKFDCSNLANGKSAGTYAVRVKTDKIAQNIYANIKFTYYNNPKSSVASIGGTEYAVGETTRIVLQIQDNEGNPLNNEDCYTTIRDSFDMVKVNNETLTYITNSNGLYFYEFDAPLPIGVYSVDSYCDFNGTKVYSADTFHVAEWTRDIGKSILPERDKHLTVKRVSGTEYAMNETAVLSVQTLRQGIPVSDPYCLITIFQPDGNLTLQKVVDEDVMINLDGSNGISFYNFNYTNTTGVYIVDVLCTEIRYGQIPLGFKNNNTDTTTNTSLEYMDGATLNVSLNISSDVVAMMTIEGTTSVNAEGSFSLEFDGTPITTQTRSFDANDEGNVVVIGYYENATAGNHTIEAFHNVSAGTLTSRGNMLTFGLQDGIKEFTSCYDTADSDTTTSATMEDVDGLYCDIVLPYESEILIMLTFEGEVDNPNHDIYYTISIDDVDYEVFNRFFGSAGSKGNLYILTKSDAPLSAGRHSIRARWHTDAGGITATLSQGTLLAFSNQVETRIFEIEKAYVSDSTIANSPEDIDDASVRVDLGQDSSLVQFMSINPETSSANERGYFLSNIEGTNGVTFARFFGGSNQRGSVGVLETKDKSTGSYILKGRWYTSAGNTLSGDIILVGMGFLTEPLVVESYQALDFHVSEWATNITTGNLTANVSTDVWEKLHHIQDMITSVNNTVKDTNSSIWGKLHLIQDDLEYMNNTLNEINETVHNISLDVNVSVDVNFTEVLNAIESVNDTVININSTIMNKLYAMQDEIVSVNDTVLAINISIINEILGLNITCPNVTLNATCEFNTTELENMIISVNNTVIASNSSIWGKLYLVQDELYNITLDLQNISNLLVLHNTTVMNKLYSIQDDLVNITVLIDEHNTTVMNKLYLIQDDLLNITNTIISLNTTIINQFNQTNTTIWNFRNEAYTWYTIIRQDIYNLYQKWIDRLDELLTDAFGIGQIIDVVPTGGGATQGERSWVDRILGR